jgi:hypothetical protein
MRESRLLQGMLVGACCFLAFGIVMTWAEVTEYKGYEPPGPLPAMPTLPRRKPAERPAETPQPAAPVAEAEPAAEPVPVEAVADVLELAPPGTMFAAAVDLSGLLGAPLLQGALAGQQIPVPLGVLSALGVFCVGEGDPMLFRAAGVVEVAEGGRGAVEDLLAGGFGGTLSVEAVTVAGMSAYQLQAPLSGVTAPLGFGPGASPAWGGLFAEDIVVAGFADDETLLFAESAQSLQLIAQAGTTPGPGPSGVLKAMVDKYPDGTVLLAGSAIPPTLLEAMPTPAEGAAFPFELGDLQGFALAVNVTESVRLRLTTRFASPTVAEWAAQAVADWLAGLGQPPPGALPEVVAQAASVGVIARKVQLTTGQADVEAQVSLTAEDLQGLIPLVVPSLPALVPEPLEPEAPATEPETAEEPEAVGEPAAAEEPEPAQPPAAGRGTPGTAPQPGAPPALSPEVQRRMEEARAAAAREAERARSR